MIPTAELPHRVTIEDKVGTSGNGAPVYGPARSNIAAKIDGRRRAVRNREGVDVIASATAVLRPRTVPPGSRVTHGQRRYEVLEAVDKMELRRVELTTLILDGPRP